MSLSSKVLTLKTKENIRNEFAELSERERTLTNERRKLVAHIDVELSQIERRKEVITSDQDDFIAYCETCDVPLFAGDSGYAYLDYEVVVCAEHAPTYGNQVAEMDKMPPVEWDDFFGGHNGVGKENYNNFKAQPADKKHVWPL